MKKLLIPALLGIAILSCNSVARDNEEDTQPVGENAEALADLSYAIGVSIGENLKQQGFEDINYKSIAQGMEEAVNGTATMTIQEAQQTIQKIQTEMRSAKFAVNLKKSEDFLAENAKKEGVQTTASGLQYKVIKEGTGASPSGSDKATVHYDGTLIDGTPFDSSRKKGTPFEFSVSGGVIKGWLEGVKLMKEGAIYEFYIHPDLGYGVNPRPGVIQPNDALVFEIELIKVN